MSEFTLTEELVLEVMTARSRLGEHLWTFPSRATKPLRSLEDKGLVQVMHGVVENSVRASFTEKGKKRFLARDYQSPILKKHADDIAGYLDQIGYDANAGRMIRAKFGTIGTIA